MLGLQDVQRRAAGSSVDGAVRGSEPGRGRIRSGKDVVNAELDLRLRFSWLVGVLEQAVLLGAQPQSVRVQRAEGGVGLRTASRRAVPIALQRMEGGFG